MKKTNLTIDDKTYKDVYIAESFYDKFKGLMFIPRQKAFSLFIKNCNSIHTCFMNFPITVICLDEEMNIIKVVENIQPFRFILPVKKTKHILEIPE